MSFEVNLFKKEHIELRKLAKDLYAKFRKINSVLTHLQLIMSGGNGSTFLGTVHFMKEPTQVSKLVIVKTESLEKDMGTMDSLLYDFRVNKKLNELRSLTLGFPLCFLYFQCPASDPAVAMCTANGRMRSYIVEERIEGVMLREFFERTSWTPEIWLSILLQLLITLQLGQSTVNFTHYDLHGSNVIVRSLKSTSDLILGLRYDKTASNLFFVPMLGHVPVMIDFGRSYVKDIDVPEKIQSDLAQTTFNEWFQYKNNVKGAHASMFCRSYDLVEFGRSMFDKLLRFYHDQHQELPSDLAIIHTILLTRYGPIIEEYPNFPTREPEDSDTNAYKEPMDLIKALLKCNLWISLCKSVKTPQFFNLQTQTVHKDAKYGFQQ